MLFKHGEQMPLELFLKDVKRPTDGILGDAASMGRSGGMC
jgi:hypothetical protein